MSKSKKLLSLLGCITILGVIGYLIAPSVLLKYVNGIMPGVHVNAVSLKSLDCVNLKGISINRHNINGNITSAVACRTAKTIDADGGSLTYTKTQESDNQDSSDSFHITAKNLSVRLVYNKYSLDLKNTSIDDTNVFATSGVASTPYGVVNLDSVNINRKTRSVTLGSVNTIQDGIGDISIMNVKVNIDGNASAKNVTIKHSKDFSVGADDVVVKYVDGLIEISARRVFTSHPMLYTDTLSVHDVKIAPFKLAELKTANHIVNIGNVAVKFNFTEKYIIGDAPCQEWLRSLPKELKNSQIEQMSLKGNLLFSLEILPSVKFKLRNGCMVDGPVPEFIKALSGKFKYTAYHPNSGDKFERVSGPGSSDWVPLESISDTMVKALTTTEDPGFFVHRGIIPLAIENSIKDNLKLGRFFRGGSTITMQLAKNLWLTRKRTIGRKIQEAILTVALESTLPKEKILELYLNVVEFGPDLYGIGPASDKLLETHPINISLSQAIYLVLRLPAPSRSGTYEQMKVKIGKMLDLMTTSGKVSEEEAQYEKAFLFEDFNDEQ